MWIQIFFIKMRISSIGKPFLGINFSLAGGVSQFTGHGVNLTEVSGGL